MDDKWDYPNTYIFRKKNVSRREKQLKRININVKKQKKMSYL